MTHVEIDELDKILKLDVFNEPGIGTWVRERYICRNCVLFVQICLSRPSDRQRYRDELTSYLSVSETFLLKTHARKNSPTARLSGTGSPHGFFAARRIIPKNEAWKFSLHT